MALNLSQLDGSNGFRLAGIDEFDNSGHSVAGAGDVNDDGIDDLIIGAPDAGESYVVFGSAAGFPASLDLSALDGSNGFRLDGIGDNGRSVASAGDINGDGIDDVIVGAPGANASFVVFGSAAGFAASLDLADLDGTNGFRLDGIDAYDFSGGSVAGVGDLNGDGIDDLIIGARYADPGGKDRAGESYVVFGSTAGFAASLDLADLDGSNGFRLDGIDAFDGSGHSVAGAGDVNGDGIDDLIIGAPSGYGAGESYVVFGSTAGFAASLDLAALDGSNGFRLVGIDEYDASGYSVAGAGDVNGDGIDDLIVGAVTAAPGGQDYAGEAYVVFGSSAGFAASLDLAALDGSNGFRLDGIENSAFTNGISVAGAGDVNGDGFDDLIVGTPRAYADGHYAAGASFVVFGSAAGFAASLDLSMLDGTTGFRLDGIEAYDLSGYSVAGAGDVNGDGIDDLIVGAPFADPGGSYSAGESYVVLGSAQLGGANDAPSAADDALSAGSFDIVDLAGDNGAGFDSDPDFDDLVITAIDGKPVTAGDSVTLASGLRVTLLGATDVRFDAPGVALGTALSDSFVYEISDGRGGSDSATVSVDYHQNLFDLATLDGTNGFRVDVTATSSFQNDIVVAGAGDVNGDGVDDIVIGNSALYYADDSYVVFGNSAGFAASIDVGDLDGTNGFSLVGVDDSGGAGASVAGAGDINGDGIGDLIVGATNRDLPYAFDGSYVVFGSSAGFDAGVDLSALDGTDGFRVEGSGFSVAGAGDINGDGIDDLLIGDPYAGDYDAGASFVVFGSSTGFEASFDLATLDGSNGFRLDGIDAYDNSGTSVANAGDVNGDGIDDLIIGATGADPGGRESAGESYVVFGRAAGFGASLDLVALDGTNGFRLDGVDAYDFSGVSVAGAGDVNGDGIDDMIIAAPYADPGGRASAGTSYVVFGSAAGFAASLDLGALDGTNGFRLDGVDTFDNSGFSVAGAGDFNGDGIDDLILGGRGGESYLVFGSAAAFAASLDLANLDGTNGFRLSDGASVEGAGDVNGDGLDDLILGSQSSVEPKSYVVFGFRTDGMGTTEASVAASSDDAEQRTRVQLASKDLDLGEKGKLVGLRFTGLEVPDGATVTGAYIEFEAKRSGRRPADVVIAVEDTTEAATFGRGAGIRGRDWRDETTAWAPEPWVKGESHRTADLAATIAALVGTGGLDADEALAFRFKGMGERAAWSFDGKGAPARLVIEFEHPASAQADAPDPGQGDDFHFLPTPVPVWDDGLLA